MLPVIADKNIKIHDVYFHFWKDGKGKEESVPVTSGDTFAHLYKVECFGSDGKWKVYKKSFGDGVEIIDRVKFCGHSKLPPGRYRIINSGLLGKPLSCNHEFIITKDSVSPIKIDVLQKKREIIKGRIQLVVPGLDSKSLAGIKIYSEFHTPPIAVKAEYKGREFISTTQKMITDSKGGVDVFFWTEAEKFTFILRSYRFVQFGNELKTSFSAEALKDKAEWTIKERPVRAMFKVFFKQKNGTETPMSPKSFAELFPEIDRDFHSVHMFIFPYNKNKEKYDHFRGAPADSGEFIPEENAYVFRSLKDNEKYIINCYMIGGGVPLVRLIDIPQRVFTVVPGKVFEQKIVASTEIVEEKKSYRLAGMVIDKAGNPIRYANIYVRKMTADGKAIPSAKKRLVARSLINGKFGLKVTEGTYQISVSHKGYEDWSKIFIINGNKQNIDVQLDTKPILTVKSKISDKTTPIVGGLIVYNSGKKNVFGRTTMLGKEKAQFRGITPGKYFVVMKGYQGSEVRELDPLTSNEYLMGIKELDITKEEDTECFLDLHKRLKIPVKLDTQGLELSEAMLVVLIEWQDMKIYVDNGRWSVKDIDSNYMFVPYAGKYLVEIILPAEREKGIEMDKYAVARYGYWADAKIEVTSDNKPVIIKIDKNSKHKVGKGANKSKK